MANILDVVVPAGVLAGEPVSFAGPSGEPLEALVPEGFGEGDTFQVTIDGDGHPVPTFNAFVERRAGTGDVMDQFVAWFEREAVGDQVDAFVQQHAHLLGGSGTEGEQSHEWWPIYQDYQSQFEALLQSFVDEAGTTMEGFLKAAEGAEGMNEIYLQIFLAHADYEMFVELMQAEFDKQRQGHSD